MLKLLSTPKIIPFFLFVLLFFLIKLSTFGIRLSDSNIYWYTGYELLQGNMLYRDIFFTNFPLFAYISAFYVFLLQGNLNLFFLTPALEAIITGTLISGYTLYKTRQYIPATLSGVVYLFSFLVLSTTDHQTGVFIASLCAVLAFILFDTKRYIFAGVFLGLTLMIKAYFLPVAFAFFVALLLQKKIKPFLFLSISMLATILVVLTPSLLFARNDFLTDVFAYSLTRGAGIPKWDIGQFFIFHDILLFLLLVWSIFLIRKQLFFGLAALFGITFFFAYQDIYYLYLNFAVPFLALSYASLHTSIHRKIPIQSGIVPTLILFFVCINLFSYFSGFHTLQRVEHIEDLKKSIQKAEPSFLYGPNDITPALAYLTNTPLLNNIVDTNTNIFRKGFLNASTLTTDALQKKTVIITHGAFYPQYNVQEFVLDEIVDKHKILKECELLDSVPIQAEGVTNRINVFSCYK